MDRRKTLAALPVFALALACGKTDREDPRLPDGMDPDSFAGMPAMASGGGPSGGGVSGGGSVSSGGSLSAAGSGGSSSPGGTAGQPTAEPPSSFPLIIGEGDCPAFAPSQRACGDVEARCIYPGIETGNVPRVGEARCDCVDREWLCVVTDQRFDSDCPLVHWTKLRDTNAACPADPERTCAYWIAGYPFGASCRCYPEQGEAGAGAAADRQWMCGL